MATNYILIDFENVRPKNLELLSRHPFTVFVFVGTSQTKIPFDLAAAMQQLGDKGRYIKIGGSGKNALDFHLAFYVGELAATDPAAEFHVISKDTGFDPLIRHLKGREIHIQRASDLAEIPVLRTSVATSSDEKISTVVKNLIGRGQSRPRKVKTLENTINSLFTKTLEDHELRSLICQLEKRGYVVLADGKVSYKLPNEL